MSRILDIEKVEVALKRAAQAATIGSTEERSGRLLLIYSADYDDERRELRITFTNGSVHRYVDVPREVYDGLLRTDSKAEFFNERIKNQFLPAEITR